tara:strand:+ start:513 stop:782 length:270 start_codon:yes stop_codon:yes gene_type:complete
MLQATLRMHAHTRACHHLAAISPGAQVRSHFETDKDAKRVLAQITEWMAEPKDTERKTVLKRLTVDAAAVTPQRSSNHTRTNHARTHSS